MTVKEARKAIKEAKIILATVIIGRDWDSRMRVSKSDALSALYGLPPDGSTEFQWGPEEYGWEPKTLLIH